MRTVQDGRFTANFRMVPLLLPTVLLACSGKTVQPTSGVRSTALDTPPPAPVAGYEWARHGGNYCTTTTSPQHPARHPGPPHGRPTAQFNAGQAGFHPLYAVWNNDLRVTAVGGEDAISRLHWTPTHRRDVHLRPHS